MDRPSGRYGGSVRRLASFAQDKRGLEPCMERNAALSRWTKNLYILKRFESADSSVGCLKNSSLGVEVVRSGLDYCFLGHPNVYVSGVYIPEIIPKTLNPFGPNKHLVNAPTCCLWVHLLK